MTISLHALRPLSLAALLSASCLAANAQDAATNPSQDADAALKARLAAAYGENPAAGAAAQVLDSAPPGQTALFNQWEDAVECARCGGRMVRTGSCYTCRDCGTNTGCS